MMTAVGRLSETKRVLAELLISEAPVADAR